MRQLNYSVAIPDTEITLLGSGPAPLIPGFTTSDKYENVVVQGKYAYIAAGGSGSGSTEGLTLVIYDVSNPANPIPLSYIPTQSVPWMGTGPSGLNGSYQMAVNGSYLYVFSSGSSYLYIVDVSNPLAPVNVGFLLISGTPGVLYGGAYSNGYVYIATQNKGLTIVNVSNPIHPVQVYQEGGTLNKSIGVTVRGNTVLTTNYQTTAPWTVRYLKSWDVTNPSAPVLLQTLTLPAGTKPAAVSINGQYAYVSDLNTNTIQIINIASLTGMFYVASMQASGTFQVQASVAFVTNVTGNYAYISTGANATYGGAIDVYDITNPATSILLKTYKQNVPTAVFGPVFIYNNLLYVSNYGVGTGTASTLNIYSSQSFISNQIIDCRNIFAGSIQLVSTNSGVVGLLNVQGSDDSTNPTDFTNIPGVTATINGASTVLIQKFDTCYQYIKLVFTNTGSNSFVANVKLLGD